MLICFSPVNLKQGLILIYPSQKHQEERYILGFNLSGEIAKTKIATQRRIHHSP